METEDRILHAALTAFAQKGKDGARMQQIADAAGVNKALLHYYYRSKDRLYEAVFSHVMERFLATFEQSVRPDADFASMLRGFIDAYMDFVVNQTDVARLLLNELMAGAATMKDRLRHIESESNVFPPAVFRATIERAVASGEIRQVDPLHTMVTTVAACILTFLALPLMQVVRPEIALDRKRLIEERKKHIFDLLYYGVSRTDSSSRKRVHASDFA